jgi:hypothetical protein
MGESSKTFCEEGSTLTAETTGGIVAEAGGSGIRLAEEGSTISFGAGGEGISFSDDTD